MPWYSKEFRCRTVARLLPPENAEISAVSAELGVPAATLELWRTEALAHAVERADPAGAAQPHLASAENTETGHPRKATHTLQTLDRGLQALMLIAQEEHGISIADLATGLGVHRAIAYRIVATLESHSLIARVDRGRLRLGAGLLTLASRFEPQLRLLARPVLRELAEATQAAAFVSVPSGEDSVAIMVTEPEGTLLRVAYRVGSRHPLGRGAAGIAILAGRAASTNDPESVSVARHQGFSVTRGELQKGAVGVASPVHGRDPIPVGLEASIGVVAFEDLDVSAAKDLVLDSARRLAAALRQKEGATHRRRPRQ